MQILIILALLLKIDGDYSYNGLKKDFEMYCPCVEKDGIFTLKTRHNDRPVAWKGTQWGW